MVGVGQSQLALCLLAWLKHFGHLFCSIPVPVPIAIIPIAVPIAIAIAIRIPIPIPIPISISIANADANAIVASFANHAASWCLIDAPLLLLLLLRNTNLNYGRQTRTRLELELWVSISLPVPVAFYLSSLFPFSALRYRRQAHINKQTNARTDKQTHSADRISRNCPHPTSSQRANISMAPNIGYSLNYPRA